MYISTKTSKEYMENYIPIQDIVPKVRVVGSKKREFKVEKVGTGKIKVSYDAIKGRGPKPFVFPEKIELNERLAEAIGLYVGDGKLSKDLNHSEFTNKDSELVKFVLNFFLKMGANISDMTFSINYRDGEEDKIRKWWSRKLGIDLKGRRVKRCDRNRFSTFRMQVNGVIFRIVLGNLIEKVMEITRDNKAARKGFLRGLFAAEGCIAVKEGYINHVSIAFNPKTEIERSKLYQKLLEIEGIPSFLNEKRGEIIIRNWKIYYRLWKIDIFNLCHRKRERFVGIMRGMKVGCLLEEKFRKDMFKGFELYQKDIAKILGTYQASICRMIQGEFLPTIEELIRASEFIGKEEFNLENIMRNVKSIRIGNLTILDGYSDEFLRLLFELKEN